MRTSQALPGQVDLIQVDRTTAASTTARTDGRNTRLLDGPNRLQHSRAEEALLTLARCLGRQAARQQLSRGRSLLELAMALAGGALILAAILYAGIFPGGAR